MVTSSQMKWPNHRLFRNLEKEICNARDTIIKRATDEDKERFEAATSCLEKQPGYPKVRTALFGIEMEEIKHAMETVRREGKALISEGSCGQAYHVLSKDGINPCSPCARCRVFFQFALGHELPWNKTAFPAQVVQRLCTSGKEIHRDSFRPTGS